MSEKRRWYQLLTGLPALLMSAVPIISCPLCWPLYTALLTALGVSFINYTPILLPLISVLIFLALISYWMKAKKTKNYWPLGIGFLAGVAIMIGKFVFVSDWILWGGVGGFIIASFLHYFSPMYVKSKEKQKETHMSDSKQNQIDPALDSLKDFVKVSKKSASAIMKMRQEIIFSEGIFSPKMKASMALVWSISAQCEPCLKYYVLKAKELGLREEELGELLAVGSVMGGCVGEMWCLKAYHAFKHADEMSESCCDMH